MKNRITMTITIEVPCDEPETDALLAMNHNDAVSFANEMSSRVHDILTDDLYNVPVRVSFDVTEVSE